MLKHLAGEAKNITEKIKMKKKIEFNQT